MSIVDIQFNIPNYTEIAEDLKININKVLAATLQTQRGLLFDHEGKWNGHKKWDKLTSRKGQILSKSGTLAKSIGPFGYGKKPVLNAGSIVRMNSNIVEIGTNIRYAAIHNYGGEILPKKAKALRFKIGNRWVFAKRVTIPQRQFDNFTQQDIDEIKTTMQNYIVSKINGKN